MLSEDTMSGYSGGLDVCPSIFLGFGSPMQAIDFDDYSEAFTDLLGAVPYPRSILVVSPFWETDNVKITNSNPDMIYDFKGGPDTLRLLTYPCEGSTELSLSVHSILNSRGIDAELDDFRGIDKGAWVPMYFGYPELDVPVVQMSLPKHASPEELFRIGQSLSDLRKTGTMILVTGNFVYDEKNYDMENKYSEAASWAKEMNDWVRIQVEAQNFDNLFHADELIPHRDNFMYSERFRPLYFMMGTLKSDDYIHTFFDKFYYGNTSQSSFAFIKKD